MESNFKELLDFLVKSMVDHPDEVDIKETPDSAGAILQLHVAPSDMGKVIGKQGRIAKAIRTVMKAAASRDNKKVMVEII